MKNSEEPPQPRCQFSGEACSTESPHYRKVISHIFGRNKRCTIGVPNFVWIYYCRKHYQRARYRTGEWPFRQCDLAIDTIKNMRAWGGVEDFNLQLRRRETQRSTGNEGQFEEDDSTVQSTGHETGESIVTHDADANDEDSSAEAAVKDGRGFNPDEPGESSEPKKRSPRIIPRPVPDWLYSRIGNHKTFSQTLQVLRDLRQHLQQRIENGYEAHFPDIEILPNLRQRPPPLHTAASKSRRVSSRGAVAKVVKKYPRSRSPVLSSGIFEHGLGGGLWAIMASGFLSTCPCQFMICSDISIVIMDPEKSMLNESMPS
ncbi:ORP1 [Coccidioides immitis H538.4]|nr:ORP1 [Coccidioides immitis H538.4]